MADEASLVSMGFPQSKVAKALRATKNTGIQSALDWLVAHEEDAAVDDEPEGSEDGQDTKDLDGEADENGSPGGVPEAKSLRCLDCGKVFRNNALASYHGEKSGHANFEESEEEIKPLTEEEKKIKLEELKTRMAEKKRILARKEAEEAKANEAIRRKGGKDASQIKAELALKEANKEALQRKKDKLADAKAKAAVREQIEADKQFRAEKSAREKALREGKPPPISATDDEQPKAANSSVSRSYDQTRLQIRFPEGGQPLLLTVDSKTTLQEIADKVREHRPASISFVLSSAFPRKTYGDDDMTKSMSDLSLTPSAVLILQ